MSEERLDYYIISLKWTRRSEDIWFWGPNNGGYTRHLDGAGLYSAERVEGNREYYDNGESTRAVRQDLVDQYARRCVRVDDLSVLCGAPVILTETGACILSNRKSLVELERENANLREKLHWVEQVLISAQTHEIDAECAVEGVLEKLEQGFKSHEVVS